MDPENLITQQASLFTFPNRKFKFKNSAQFYQVYIFVY